MHVWVSTGNEKVELGFRSFFQIACLEWKGVSWGKINGLRLKETRRNELYPIDGGINCGPTCMGPQLPLR